MSGKSLCDHGIKAERGPLVGFVLLIDKGALTWSGKAGHRPAPTPLRHPWRTAASDCI